MLSACQIYVPRRSLSVRSNAGSGTLKETNLLRRKDIIEDKTLGGEGKGETCENIAKRLHHNCSSAHVQTKLVDAIETDDLSWEENQTLNICWRCCVNIFLKACMYNLFLPRSMRGEKATG